MRTITCTTCHQPLSGDWTTVYCYCSEWSPTSHEDMGSLLSSREVVRLTDNGTLVAVSTEV